MTQARNETRATTMKNVSDYDKRLCKVKARYNNVQIIVSL